MIVGRYIELLMRVRARGQDACSCAVSQGGGRRACHGGPGFKDLETVVAVAYFGALPSAIAWKRLASARLPRAR